MKDVKLWFAYDKNKEVIKIGDADINKTYFCPCCGADVFPKATKSKKVSMHFCHVSGESCSDNGGESYIHKWIKTVLFTPNQSIKVNTKDGIKEYAIKEVEIEKRYETSQGDYIPDISVLTHEGENIFVEICNTNKKSIDKYWLKWFELGKMVIELKVKDVLDNNFELGILEPIYEDSDKFGRFKEKDYKELVGKKVDDKEREKIETLYNRVYNYINGNEKIDIFMKYGTNGVYEYVCERIRKEIYEDIKVYSFLLWIKDKYKLDDYLMDKIDNFRYDNKMSLEDCKNLSLVCEKCGNKINLFESYEVYCRHLHLKYFNMISKYKTNMCMDCAKNIYNKEADEYFLSKEGKQEFVGTLVEKYEFRNKWGYEYENVFDFDGYIAVRREYVCYEKGTKLKIKSKVKKVLLYDDCYEYRLVYFDCEKI